VTQSTDVVLSLHTTVGQQASLASPSLCNSRPSHTAKTSDSLERAATSVQKAQKRQRTVLARLRGPRWIPLISRVLEISGSKAPSGWDFSIRTYNVVPVNSPVMVFARHGELSKLQGLITEGKASILDRDEFDRDLLSVRTFLFVLLSYNDRIFKTSKPNIPRLQFCATDSRLSNLYFAKVPTILSTRGFSSWTLENCN